MVRTVASEHKSSQMADFSIRMVTIFRILFSDTSDDGCDGGITIYAYEYVYTAGGIQSNVSYPYTSYWGLSSGTCESDSEDFQVHYTTQLTILVDDRICQVALVSIFPLAAP